MFVELRDIALRWELYHLFFYPHIHYGIAFYAHAPSVAPLRACEIDGIASLPLTDKHAIVHQDRVTAHIPVHDVYAVVGPRNGHRAHAVAALEDIKSHTEDKDQAR